MLAAKTRFLILVLVFQLACSACGPKGKLATTLSINLIPGSEELLEEILSEELISDLLFQSLTYIDPEMEKAIPALASSWEVDESNTIWTFHLRDDVPRVFTNESGDIEKGESVNAYDFQAGGIPGSLFNVRWAITFRASYLIKSINAIDTCTLEFTLNESDEDFDKIASQIIPFSEDDWRKGEFVTALYHVISGEALEKWLNLSKPASWPLREDFDYSITSAIENDFLVLIQNKDPLIYGDPVFIPMTKDKNFPDEIVFTWLDEETAVQKFQDGELDVIEISDEGEAWSGFEGTNAVLYLEGRYFAVQEEKSDAFTQLTKVGEGKRKFIAEYIPSRMEEAKRLLDAAFDHLAVHKCEEGVPEALKALQICGWMADFPTPENYKADICSARANLMLENIDPAIENLKAALEKDIPDCDRKEIESIIGDLYLRRAQKPCRIWDIDFNQGCDERGYPIEQTDTYEGNNKEISVNWQIDGPDYSEECKNRLVVKWLHEGVLQCFQEIFPEDGVKIYASIYIFGSIFYEDDGGYLEEGTWEIQIWDGAKMIFSEQIPID